MSITLTNLTDSKTSDFRLQPNASAEDLAHIPGDYGLPVIGKTFSFFTDFDKAMYSHTDKYGPVSKTQLRLAKKAF